MGMFGMQYLTNVLVKSNTSVETSLVMSTFSSELKHLYLHPGAKSFPPYNWHWNQIDKNLQVTRMKR